MIAMPEGKKVFVFLQIRKGPLFIAVKRCLEILLEGVVEFIEKTEEADVVIFDNPVDSVEDDKKLRVFLSFGEKIPNLPKGCVIINGSTEIAKLVKLLFDISEKKD